MACHRRIHGGRAWLAGHDVAGWSLGYLACADRTALRETERRRPSALTEARARVESLIRERQEHETRLATVGSAGEAATQEAAKAGTQLAATGVALTTPQDDTDLRTRLLSALLNPISHQAQSILLGHYAVICRGSTSTSNPP